MSPTLAALGMALGLVGVLAPPAQALPYETTNEFAQLWTWRATTGVRADLAAGDLHRGNSVWIALSGGGGINIIQSGAYRHQDGTRTYFLAYGSGDPGATGSSYVEKSWGHPGGGFHRYVVRLRGDVWVMKVDGAVVARISDDFRKWTQARVSVSVEGEDAPVSGGTASKPTRIATARLLTNNGNWVKPVTGWMGHRSWNWGGDYADPGPHEAAGSDWLAVWR